MVDGADRALDKDTTIQAATRLSGPLQAVERATSWVERPVRAVARSHRLNPLPHAGTISVFLLGVVTVSGLYITLFFEFGYVASYESVAAMENHAIQKVVRALHRYSSAALIVTTLVHAWRIFVARRFVGGARRWRWATGVGALAVVWLAGVTGYWLIWDRRAAAISEATMSVLDPIGLDGWSVRNLTGVTGSGSGFLLFIWFVHLALTAVAIYFAWRHLRRTALPWYPPRLWMALMGGALLFVSLAVPVGMLGPARPDRLVADMPIDPFVLFLLPPLLSGAAGAFALVAVAVLGLAIVIPRLLRRVDPDPVVVDEEACTGCELCVVDCPYEALTMSGSANDGRGIAVVDAAACVACGICLGSCAFDAIELPGAAPPPPDDVAGRDVVIACDRHASTLDPADTQATVLYPVRCAGMFAPTATRIYGEAGARSVHLVGCAPADCRYGVGNRLASERLTAGRAPHPPRRYSALTVQDWIEPDELAAALPAPGQHPVASGDSRPAGRNALVGAGAIVVLSVVAIAFATRAPFRSDSSAAELRVIVDHEAGLALEGVGVAVGDIDSVEVAIDGDELEPVGIERSGADSLGLATWPVAPGLRRVEITAIGPDGAVVLLDEEIEVEAGERLVLSAIDIPPPPGVSDGREVFASRAAGCDVCHSVQPGVDKVGPSLFGVASVAGDRVAGLDAAGYLRQSILLPDQYIVEGWPAGQMLPIYRDRLSDRDLEALIEYLLSLEESQ